MRGIVNKLLSSVYNPTDASPNFGHDQTWVAERREEFFIHDLRSWTVARSSFALPPPTFGEGIPC